METKNVCENRKNGVYYTPGLLADFLVKPLIDDPYSTIFDPAYGDGSLLLAAEKYQQQKNNSNRKASTIFGCDRQPSNGRLAHFPPSHLIKQDFFDFSPANQYDIILMNPPYVRHYLMNPVQRARYNLKLSTICKVTQKSDLWVYFLIKSILHLKKNGSIGAILPWSFLQAGYARQVRQWLLDRFAQIEVFAATAEYFKGTEERVLLVWLRNYAQKTRSIKISFSEDVHDQPVSLVLDKDSWHSAPAAVSSRYDCEALIRSYMRDYRFVRFEKVARVFIGIATGADKFFILPIEEAGKRGFRQDSLIPILSSAKQFTGLQLDENTPQKRLLLLPGKNTSHEIKYIKEGEQKGYHLRAHSRRRSPWHLIKTGQIPDAFFPYRMSWIPYLMFNNQAQSTNSIHRVYFDNLSEHEKKWIQLSLLAVPGQLSIESYAKTYGRGVLKIEPGALKKSIVYVSDDPAVDSIYEKVSRLISSNRKYEAMELAEYFLNSHLQISDDLCHTAFSAMKELQARRLNCES